MALEPHMQKYIDCVKEADRLVESGEWPVLQGDAMKYRARQRFFQDEFNLHGSQMFDALESRVDTLYSNLQALVKAVSANVVSTIPGKSFPQFLEMCGYDLALPASYQQFSETIKKCYDELEKEKVRRKVKT